MPPSPPPAPDPAPLYAAVARFEGLPVITEQHMLLQSILADASPDPGELLRTVESDPAFAANLMRRAGTVAGTHGRMHPIGTLGEAIDMLGTAGLQELMARVEVVRGFGIPSGLDMRGFWDHSVDVALLARQLAAARGLDAERAYLAGLMHDVGALMLVQHLPTTFETLLRASQATGVSIHVACLQAHGCTPLDLSARLADAWRLEADLTSLLSSLGSPELPLTAQLQRMHDCVKEAHRTSERHGGSYPWDVLPTEVVTARFRAVVRH